MKKKKKEKEKKGHMNLCNDKWAERSSTVNKELDRRNR